MKKKPRGRFRAIVGNAAGAPRVGGRKKGTPNKVTAEARQAAGALVDDPIYLKKLAKDFKVRKVHPSIEAMIWHYAKGKPVDRTEVGGPGDFNDLTDAEVLAELELAKAALEETMRLGR